MATIQMPLGTPEIESPNLGPGEGTMQHAEDKEARLGEKTNGPSVILISAYFLALASVAVIAVGGHFPWFTVAPATVLSLVAYFRHVEATLERESSG